MKLRITGLLLFLAFGLFGQTVRTVGVVYTASAPVHTPSGQGAWIAVDTTSGSWYEWERTTGVWRDAGYRIQLTNTTGVPNYTPSKARGRVALNSGDSLYAYQAGAWDCLNCVTASDTATYLLQDSILVYYANGIEFDRDTIDLGDIDLSGYVEWSDTTNFISTHQDLKDTANAIRNAIPAAGLTGNGVANYLPQYATASTLDTTGMYWDASLGGLGIGIASSILARLHVKGVSGITSNFLVESSGSGAIITTNNNGITYWGSSGTSFAPMMYPADLSSGGGFPTISGRSLEFKINSLNTAGFNYSANAVNTSGAHSLVLYNPVFGPTSGSASFSVMTVSGFMNQSGGASGISRGIFVNPSFGAAADYRAVEITNNTHFGIYQSGASAKNYFNGKAGFGTTTPVARLHITGEGTTSSTTALLVEKSDGVDIIKADNGGFVTIGAGANTSGAVLDVQSTTAVFAPPRMTTAQRDALTPPTGGIIFCTDCTATDGSTGVSQTYSSGTWKNHY